jgi:hypothetical protein
MLQVVGQEGLCFEQSSFAPGWHLFSRDRAAELRAQSFAEFVPTTSRAAAESGSTRTERERTMVAEARVAAQLCADSVENTAFFRSQIKAAFDKAAATTPSKAGKAAGKRKRTSGGEQPSGEPSSKRKQLPPGEQATGDAIIPNPPKSSKSGRPDTTRKPNVGAARGGGRGGRGHH